MRRKKRTWIRMAAASLLVGGVYAAELSFAPIFNDGAVLQCEMPVHLWGKADPGSKVDIRLDGAKVTEAVVEADGKWKAILPTQKPGGAHIVEAISDGASSKISDVWFGEVWLASGQSNMGELLRNANGGKERLAMTLPEIRFVKVPPTTGLPVEKEFTAVELAWKTFAPPNNQEFSAVAFFFAEQIQQATGRRIGIIQSSNGGTPCEAWTPEWALDAKPEFKHLAEAIRKGCASSKPKEQWQAESKAFYDAWLAHREWAKTQTGPEPKTAPQPGPDNPWESKSPTVLYENMIAPLVPYTARGVVWYQGEADAGNPNKYRVIFPTLIDAWRKAWDRPDWPFFFVQLSAFSQPAQDWPGLRAAQAFTRDTVPHTGMALAIDHGEKENIHPRAKQPVGERLARLALDQVYGQDMVSRGPAFQALEIKNGKVQVRFQYSENGLKTSDGRSEVPGFEIAGEDKEFHPAQARIVSKDVVELWSDAVSVPTSVRYAWHDWVKPPVTLQNSEGLPAEPFKSGQ